MGYKRRRGGRPFKKRRFGGAPSPSRLAKELTQKEEQATCPFDFVMVAIKLLADDPRAKRKPRIEDTKVYLAEIKRCLIRGSVYASLGHVPLEPKTIVFLVKISGNSYKKPEMRVYSTSSGWRVVG